MLHFTQMPSQTLVFARGQQVGRDTAAVVARVDLDHGDAARLGAIVVDIEQLASDEPLRDARIRNDYLESHRYPLATLQNSTLAFEG